MAANDFSVSGKSNECSCASARSNSFCACGLHEVLNSTLPKPSFLACASSSASTPKLANPNKDATSEAISLGFIGRSPSPEDEVSLRRNEGIRQDDPVKSKPLEIQAANRHHGDRGQGRSRGWKQRRLAV